jgi:hypothetical protein
LDPGAATTRYPSRSPCSSGTADFGSIADDLLRAGHGQAHCALCDVRLRLRVRWPRNDDGVGPGWRFNRWLCPAGHPLLGHGTEWAHFMMRKREYWEAG